MRAHLFPVALAATVLGCGKGTPKPVAPAAPAPTSAPLARSFADLDNLWALAPADSTLGIVVSPIAVARLEAGLADIDALFGSAPELAVYKTELDKQLTEILGTATPTLAAAGLSHDKGAALFVVKGVVEPVVILPVADHAKFLAMTKGTTGADGVDTVGASRCKTVKAVYACAQDASLLDRLGTGKGELRTRLVEVAGERGDIEAVGALPFGPQAAVAAAVQLERGTITVRGAVSGLPAAVTSTLGNATPRTAGEQTAGFGVLNIKPLIGNVPAVPLAQGVNADELVRTAEGPLTATMAPGSLALDVRLPLNDAGPMQKVIDQCAAVYPFALFGAKVIDHTCQVPVPQLPAITFDLWTENSELRLGKRHAPPVAVRRVPMSAVGDELAGNDWTVALYGRGLMFGGGWLAASQVPPESLPFMRMVMLVNELGVGARVEGDKVRFLFHARTLYANPDDVVRAVLALETAKIISGEANGSLQAIADGAKSSPFAADLSAGYGGIMIPTAGLAFAAGYMLPHLLYDVQPPPRATSTATGSKRPGR